MLCLQHVPTFRSFIEKVNIFLFFTCGVSLKTWDETGLLDREILLYKELIKKGLKVSFITYGDESDCQYQDKLGDIEIIPFYAFIKRPSNSRIRFIQSFFLPFILKDKIKKANILKTNQMSTTWAPFIAKFLYRKKLIVRCGFEWYRFYLKRNHSLLKKMYLYLTECLFYNSADAIILASESDKQYIIDQFGVMRKEKITVIHNYIDSNIFKPIANIKKKEHLIFIGRLTYQKNLFNLLEALKGSTYTFDIIGDGELKSDIHKYASGNNIKVNFLGRIPNAQIPKVLNQYEVFILPSFYEGNPKVLLEAMSCGLAVIGTDVEGIRDIIRHRENGYLCKTDSTSIGEAIEAVMKDKPLRQRMSVNARKYILENHHIEKIVEKENELYCQLIC